MAVNATEYSSADSIAAMQKMQQEQMAVTTCQMATSFATQSMATAGHTVTAGNAACTEVSKAAANDVRQAAKQA